MKLTAQAVNRLRLADGKRQEDIKDDLTPGLYLRLYASGRRSWVYRYKLGGRTRVMTIGEAGCRTGTLSLAEAREKALEARTKVRAGLDPGAEARRALADARRMPTVEDFIVEYIDRYSKPNKRSWREDERLLRREVFPEIGRLRLDQVHRRDVIALLDRIRDRGAPILSNRVLAVVRRMFGFAVERGVLDTTPVTHIRAVRETARERVLTDVELKRLWKTTDAIGPEIDQEASVGRVGDDEPVRMHPATRLALRLLLLTGARAGEVCGMERGELELEPGAGLRWLLPGRRSKNGLAHSLPLSEPAAETVEAALENSWSDRWVFPASRGDSHLTGFALTQAMARIFDGTDDRPTVHDIRRTVGTRLGELGFNRLIVDKMLNHKDRSVGGIYDRYSYETEKRVASEVWAGRLMEIVGYAKPTEKVIPLSDIRSIRH